MFTKRICIIGLLGSAIWAGAGAAAAQTLTVGGYGGIWGDALEKCVLQPFAKEANVTVVQERGVSSVTLGRLRQQKSAPQMDVAWMDAGVSETANDDGVVESLSTDAIPNMRSLDGKALYKNSSGQVYALSQGFISFGVIYNSEKLKTPPTSWWDLWKPEYAGKLSLPSTAQSAAAMMIVHLNKILGGTVEDVAPALNKLRELKVSSFYAATGAAISSFQTGETDATVLYHTSAWTMQDQGQPAQLASLREGLPAYDWRVHLVKNGKNPELAKKLINYAVSPTAYSCLAEVLFVAPPIAGLKLSDRAAARMPWGKGGSLADLQLLNWNDLNRRRDAILEQYAKTVIAK